jgi:hypothetical protein
MLQRTLLAMALAGTVASAQAQTDIENVIVETYYISDPNDATDTNGGALVTGSRTYRVYIDLCDSCALRSIYGDTNHVLSIQSTAVFFNNVDRGMTFGHTINNAGLDENTVAVDSWLSFAAASNQKFGVVKDEDTDGSIVGGSPNNDGGSANIAAGLLANTDVAMGLPLTTQDGLVPLNGGTALPPGFSAFGDDPSIAFGDANLSSSFASDDFRMACSTPGVRGPNPSNKVLVAQLTTTGDLTFNLNVEIEGADGVLRKYVSSDSVLLADETLNGLLLYPPTCGCTDPNFLEFDPSAGCDDGSCQTLIIFGCLDTLACNYDPGANFNVSQLCCYGPDSCNGLDVSIVCPGVGITDPSARDEVKVFPNPAMDKVSVEVDREGPTRVDCTLYDPLGRLAAPPSSATVVAYGLLQLDLTALAAGPYLLVLRMNEEIQTHRILKQ